jgi:tetratricopeptide (TPR) repeat protein
LRRKLGDKLGAAYALNNLGTVAEDQNDLLSARTFYQETLTLCEELGDHRNAARACANLGGIDLSQHNPIGAAKSFVKALMLFKQIGERRGIAECLAGLAELTMAEGEPSQAARLFGAAEILRETINAPLELRQRAHVESVVAMIRSQLGETAFAAAWAAGRALTPDRAMAEALQMYDRES